MSKALPDLLSSKSLPELMARPYAFRSQKIVGTLLDQANRVIKRFEKNRSEGHEASISEVSSGKVETIYIICFSADGQRPSALLHACASS